MSGNRPKLAIPACSLFVLPCIAIVLFAGLTMLARYPHKFNYPIAVTEANAPYLYTSARQMMAWIKLEICCTFGLFEWDFVRAASGADALLGVWVLPLVLTVLLGTLIFFVIRIGRAG